MTWTIREYNGKVTRTINEFPAESRISAYRTMELLREYGPYHKENKCTKHWEGNIWEIIANSPDTWDRVFYIATKKDIWLLLALSGKQSNTTPTGTAQLVRKRAKEVQNQ